MFGGVICAGSYSAYCEKGDGDAKDLDDPTRVLWREGMETGGVDDPAAAKSDGELGARGEHDA